MKLKHFFIVFLAIFLLGAAQPISFSAKTYNLYKPTSGSSWVQFGSRDWFSNLTGIGVSSGTDSLISSFRINCATAADTVLYDSIFVLFNSEENRNRSSVLSDGWLNFALYQTVVAGAKDSVSIWAYPLDPFNVPFSNDTVIVAANDTTAFGTTATRGTTRVNSHQISFDTKAFGAMIKFRIDVRDSTDKTYYPVAW